MSNAGYVNSCVVFGNRTCKLTLIVFIIQLDNMEFSPSSEKPEMDIILNKQIHLQKKGIGDVLVCQYNPHGNWSTRPSYKVNFLPFSISIHFSP